jgi:hypothetical protein
VLIGLSYKILMSLPNISGSLFKWDEFVSTRGVFHIKVN